MKPALFPILCLILAACGAPAPGGNGSDAADSNLADTVTAAAAPVPVGDLGPSFNACNAAGTTRHIAAGETLPVRSAPFDNGDQVGAIPAGAQFFVCARSLDQKWFGLVYSPDGKLAGSCGVARPVSARQAYSGPCKSGWVASAYVELIAGDDDQPGQAAVPPAATH